VLNDIIMNIWTGHVHAVAGPDGAGKTTLASAIMVLSGYTGITGRIAFDGQEITDREVDE
jgi:Fe-S cluster assembly ATP-binding protein